LDQAGWHTTAQLTVPPNISIVPLPPQAHNAEVQRVRARIEKVFGTCKRSYGLRRMRWLGLAKAGLQVRLTAMAYNIRRSWRLLKPILA
jgi:hypothetical protein